MHDELHPGTYDWYVWACISHILLEKTQTVVGIVLLVRVPRALHI